MDLTLTVLPSLIRSAKSIGDLFSQTGPSWQM